MFRRTMRINAISPSNMTSIRIVRPSIGTFVHLFLEMLFNENTIICKFTTLSSSLFRKILGYFNFLTLSFVPGWLSSFAAILVEKPSRRIMLATYVTNVVSIVQYGMEGTLGCLLHWSLKFYDNVWGIYV